jgi:hypothetical protein
MPFDFGRREMAIAAALVLLVVLISVPLGRSWSKRAMRDEVPTNVEAIRLSEIEYHGAFESYVSAASAPRDMLDVDSMAVPWTPTDGFQKLSWEPAQAEVRGSYSVNARSEGFTVIGVCDLDEDQVQARYTATLEASASAASEGSVY